MKKLKNYFRLLAEGHKNGILSRLLQPVFQAAGKIFGIVSNLRRWCYDKKILPKKRLPFPVVSIGNLTWGGTGKTPLVEYLARRICSLRRTPLVLTRGYGQDEVKQLRHHLPRAVLGVGENRTKVAETIAKEKRIDVAILDDGLQHIKVERDVEIITLNSINPFGNEKLIPAGILREPLSVLKYATIVVLTHVNLLTAEKLKELKERIEKLAPKAQIVQSYLEPLFFYRARNRSRVSLDKMDGRKVATFAAVGTPRSFQLVLQMLNIKTIRNFEFMDHHAYSEKELKEIEEVSQMAGADEIVTTEKDFYRSQKMISGSLNPLILATRLRILSGENILTDRLFRVLGVKR